MITKTYSFSAKQSDEGAGCGRVAHLRGNFFDFATTVVFDYRNPDRFYTNTVFPVFVVGHGRVHGGDRDDL